MIIDVSSDFQICVGFFKKEKQQERAAVKGRQFQYYGRLYSRAELSDSMVCVQ